MKRIVLSPLLIVLLLMANLLVQAKPDPAVESATVAAAPALWPRLTPEAYENITFQVKNYGDATSDPDVTVVISLSALNFDETFNPATHITQVSGPTQFTFTYDPATKVLIGILSGEFASGDAGLTTFKINKLVVQQKSLSSNAVIGANLNIVTFGALNETTSNDQKSAYTFTSPRISGNIFNDTNGNAVKDAGETYATNVWVNLVASNGTVFNSVKVGSSGEYQFDVVNYNTNYKIILSSTNQIFNTNLTTAELPSGFAGTGVNLSNTPSTLNKSSVISLNTGEVNSLLQNFGIEQAPTALSRIATYNVLAENAHYTLSPNASNPQSALGATDPEDGNLGTGATFIITGLPANVKLYYDGVQVTAADVIGGVGTAKITNYDPDKLAFSFNTKSYQESFNYKVVDAAGVLSPDATYTINAVSLLPVTGLHLTGELIANQPKITWTTLTEQNTLSFEISKSYDGNSFSTIATVKAAGNSNALLTYNYTDAAISANKIVYYRVTLVDANGRKTASNIIYLSLKSLDISLLPNPANDHVMVVGIPQGSSLMLMDVKGRLIQQQKDVSNTFRINLKGFASGTYMIQVLQNGKLLSTKKFIKE